MTPEELEAMFADLNSKPLSCLDAATVAGARLLQPQESIFNRFRNDPIGYASEVLKVDPWSMQQDVLRLVSSPPNDEWKCKLALGAGTNAGKTFIGAVIINWFYDCRGPCIIPTTAPSQQSVVDVLWKEVRVQRARADTRWGIGPQDFIGPSAPQMRRQGRADWWAKGFVAAKGETWKGRHAEHMMFIFDEAVGMPEMYFETTGTMFQPGGDHLWICLYNPTDTTSPMYMQIIHPESDWYVMELSSLEHPNIVAELAGKDRPTRSAVSLDQLESAMRNDCEPVVVTDEVRASDFEWPPGSGEFWRPGKSFEWSYLGRWPTGDDDQLWSDALWKACTVPLTWADVKIPAEEIPRVGCDVATKGIDKTDIHTSWGDYSVHHESRGQANPMATCGRLIIIAETWAEKANAARKNIGIEQLVSAKQIPIMIDDDGVGGTIGARLREQGYRVFPIGASTKPRRYNRYPNKRSELWFETADRARIGHVHMGLLPKKVLDELKRQSMAPTWDTNSAGQREIESKERMRARLGRSPDGADARNLSYFMPGFHVPEVLQVENMTFQQRVEASKVAGALSGNDGNGNRERVVMWRGRHRGGRGGRGLFRK